MVMAFHGVQRLDPSGLDPLGRAWYDFFITGSAGASVFFVLSGFLLTAPFWRAWLGRRELPRPLPYLARRAARILPAYWLALTVSFLVASLAGVVSPAWQWDRFWEGFRLTSAFSWATLFPVELNQALWSVSFQAVAYVFILVAMVPLYLVPQGLFQLPGRTARKLWPAMVWWLVILGLVVAANGWLQEAWLSDDQGRGRAFGLVGGAKYWWPRYNPVAFLAPTVLGILASGFCQWGVAHKRNPARGGWGWDLLGAGFLLSLSAFLWLVKGSPEFSHSIQSQPYYFPGFAILVSCLLGVLPLGNFFSRLMDNPALRFLGSISYGLFLWHYFYMAVAGLVLGGAYGVGTSQPGPVWLGVTALCWLLAGLTALVSLRYLERPVLSWTRARLASWVAR